MFSLATKLLLAAALICVATAPARAGSDDGGSAYEGEDYEITLPALRFAAEHGIAGAQSKLDSMYQHGLGVPVDHIMAYMWCSPAKAQGNERAARDRA
jgi:TPR repeat protein